MFSCHLKGSLTWIFQLNFGCGTSDGSISSTVVASFVGSSLTASNWVTFSHLSHSARSWLRPTFTNIILALKSSCCMTSVRRQASTSGLVSLRDSARQWPMSWCPQAAWSVCRDKTATHRYALGACTPGKDSHTLGGFTAKCSLYKGIRLDIKDPICIILENGCFVGHNLKTDQVCDTFSLCLQTCS